MFGKKKRENEEKKEIVIPERRILKNKIFLYLTEFFAGMSVMAIELGAQRLLAPYFSSSQIVWTIVIATIMIAMALGNIYGGKMADKNPNPDKLYLRLIICAVWIALVPFLGKYIIAGISAILIFAVNQNFLIVAATGSCLLLFIFPLFLLGTTTPCLVKYTVSSLNDSGKTVGYLNAFNTIGSILGTFLPTFVTIPYVGTNITFIIFASILFILSCVYFISSKVFKVRMPVGLLLIVIGIIFGYRSHFAFWESDLLYEGESQYNYLQVYEDNSVVSFSTNVLFGVQSVYYKDESSLSSSHYATYGLIAPYMANYNEKENPSMLILGMGTGTYATITKRYFPNYEIEGVEIDQKIVDLSREYFHLSEDIDVYTYDGRAFLNVCDKKYDIIMVDAYQDITIPFQMSSIEFFESVKEHLTDDGVLYVNLNMRSDKEDNINYYLCDTIGNAFKYIYQVDVKYSSNRVLFASQKDIKVGLDEKMFADKDRVPYLYDILNKTSYCNIYNSMELYQKGDRLLTDDKAPVELLGISVIDSLIKGEVDYYKKIFKEEGLTGLLKRLS